MSGRRALLLAGLLATLAGCGGGHPAKLTSVREDAPAPVESPPATSAPAVPAQPSPQALVTDEKQNQLLAVALPAGRIVRRVPLPADPEDVAADGDGGLVMVVSSGAGRLTALERQSLRPVKTFGGFDQPHIVEISPDGQYAYLTDDARGTVTVIRLSDLKVTSTTDVGLGAHHLTFSPDERRVWVALGESASRISILDSSDLARPRLIGSLSPGFPVHDLSFSPNGRQIWVSSAAGPDTAVFAAASRRLLFHVAVGPPPQHLTFAGPYAYLTSGYGSAIEKVEAASGRVVARARAPYGSFELAVADGYVTTASLLRGTLAIYTPGLRLVRVVRLAPAAREVAISRP